MGIQDPANYLKEFMPQHDTRGVSSESQYMLYREYMLYFYEIICAYAHNYMGREQKEAISVEVDLVVAQLYLILGCTVLIPFPFQIFVGVGFVRGL